MEERADTAFISYRRSTSKYPALLVYYDLIKHGYDAFIDYESIDSGKFAPEILNQIASRRHFIAILSPRCLDRTTDPEDWLRKEIEYAIKMQRNIVPVMFDEFKFEANTKYLTGDLSTLKEYNGVTVPDGYFDDAMKKVRTRFLKQPARGTITPAPKKDETFVQNAIQKANHAAQQESVVSAASKYTGNPRWLKTPSLVDIILANPNRVKEKIYPIIPATASILDCQPYAGELIYLNETVTKVELRLFNSRNGQLIITDKRLIFKVPGDKPRSFEISMAVMSHASLSYSDFMGQFTIKTPGGQIYVFGMTAEVAKRVKSLAGELSPQPKSFGL